jgi:hypothetical protein
MMKKNELIDLFHEVGDQSTNLTNLKHVISWVPLQLLTAICDLYSKEEDFDRELADQMSEFLYITRPPYSIQHEIHAIALHLEYMQKLFLQEWQKRIRADLKCHLEGWCNTTESWDYFNTYYF